MQQIQASYVAFAAILGDGSIATWGNQGRGGDSSSVPDQLKSVQQIQFSRRGAFAAIPGNGSVITFGGGSSSSVQDQLRNESQNPAPVDMLP